MLVSACRNGAFALVGRRHGGMGLRCARLSRTALASGPCWEGELVVNLEGFPDEEVALMRDLLAEN